MNKFPRWYTWLPITCIALLMTAGACKKGIPAIPIPPTITAINPTSGVAGAQVTITGTNFRTNPTDNTVKFNGVVAAVTSATTTSLVVNAPAAGSTGPISVTTADGTAAGPVFTYIVIPPPPTITSISPITGGAGTVVTVNGTNFKPILTDNVVKFNGIAATVQTATTTAITVAAPATGTTGAVTVTTADGTATGPVFTYAATDVYVVGQSTTGWGYWKNGVFTARPSDCFSLRAIYVSGTDVYLAGVNTTYAPAYWKNGVGVSLPISAGHVSGSVWSIAVSGTDVFTAGSDQGSGAGSLPDYWKNSTLLSLATTYNGGEAYSIFVSGTDVYAAGYQWSMVSGGNSIATYWKNGAPVTLTTGATNDVAYAVYISGSDVYVAGTEGAAGKYWKNGAANLLNVPNTSYKATPASMYVTGTDVYIAGSYTNLAKYWKNGAMVDLTATTAGGITAEYATGIAGKGTDIYICGNDVSKGYGYWKNGVFTVLPGAGIVNGIFVK